MEPVFQAHPIPQNVTNFEFHLVGDMTLKQFGYLAAGLGFAFLIFTTLSTVQPLIAWPIIVISALLGVAFAFLPIQERPLDHWVAAFFKAIFKPTSLKYSSKIINPDDPLFNRRLNHYLKTYSSALTSSAYQKAQLQPAALPPPPNTPSQVKKYNFIDKFKAGQTSFGPPIHPHSAQSQPVSSLNQSPVSTSLQSQNIQPPASVSNFPPPTSKIPSTIPLPDLSVQDSKAPAPPPSSKTQESKKIENSTPEELKKTVELAKEAQETQQEIIKIESSLSQIKQQAAKPGVDPKTYIEEFEDSLTKLQKLNEKASKIAEELARISNLPQPELESATSNPVTNPTPIKAKSIPTLKLTSFPNVINGIVTDSLGNYIEGAIVVAHDKQGLPVRALKSNKLGQFVAATPLPNGEYAIVVEKENLSFDKVGVELKNEVLPPILIAAKKLVAAS